MSINKVVSPVCALLLRRLCAAVRLEQLKVTSFCGVLLLLRFQVFQSTIDVGVNKGVNKGGNKGVHTQTDNMCECVE